VNPSSTPQPAWNDWSRDLSLNPDITDLAEDILSLNRPNETHAEEYREENARAARRMADIRDGGVEETSEEWLVAERRQDLIADGLEEARPNVP